MSQRAEVIHADDTDCFRQRGHVCCLDEEEEEEKKKKTGEEVTRSTEITITATKSGELDSSVATTEKDRDSEIFESFYTGASGEVLNFALSRTTTMFPGHRKFSLLNKLQTLNISFLTGASIKQQSILEARFTD
jgi:hypothetical protein